MNLNKESIERFAKYLSAIRKIYGLSSEKLAEYLDVSRITMINIETGKKPMSKVMYIAIRTFLEGYSPFRFNYGKTSDDSFCPCYGTRVTRYMVDFNDDKFKQDLTESILQIVDDTCKKVGRKAGSEHLGTEINLALKTIMPEGRFVWKD